MAKKEPVEELILILKDPNLKGLRRLDELRRRLNPTGQGLILTSKPLGS